MGRNQKGSMQVDRIKGEVERKGWCLSYIGGVYVLFERRKEMGKVKIVEYIRPNGRTKSLSAEVSPKTKRLVEEYDMELSAEVITEEEVAMYAKLPEKEELVFIADNGPGNNSPIAVLERLVVHTLKHYGLKNDL